MAVCDTAGRLVLVPRRIRHYMANDEGCGVGGGRGTTPTPPPLQLIEAERRGEEWGGRES